MPLTTVPSKHSKPALIPPPTQPRSIPNTPKSPRILHTTSTSTLLTFHPHPRLPFLHQQPKPNLPTPKSTKTNHHIASSNRPKDVLLLFTHPTPRLPRHQRPLAHKAQLLRSRINRPGKGSSHQAQEHGVSPAGAAESVGRGQVSLFPSRGFVENL